LFSNYLTPKKIFTFSDANISLLYLKTNIGEILEHFYSCPRKHDVFKIFVIELTARISNTVLVCVMLIKTN